MTTHEYNAVNANMPLRYLIGFYAAVGLLIVLSLGVTWL